MDKLKSAIIGHTGKGDFGHRLDNTFEKFPEVETVAVVDFNPEGIEGQKRKFPEAKFYTNVEEMLYNHDVTILTICQRNPSTRIDIFKCCKDKSIKGIICEKPLAVTTKEASEILEICDQSNISLVVAHRRANPYESYAKELIKKGKIGDLITIKSRGKCDHRSGGEDLAVLGIHMMDSMRYMVGCEVKSVNAKILKKKREIVPSDVHDGNEGIGLVAGDTVFANYLFENGVMGMFESYPIKTTVEKHSSFFGFEVYGSTGILCVRNSPLGEMSYLNDCVWSSESTKNNWQKIEIQSWDDIASEERTHASNEILADALLTKLRTGHVNENVSWGYDALKATEMIGATLKSAVTNSEVELPLVDLDNPYLHW